MGPIRERVSLFCSFTVPVATHFVHLISYLDTHFLSKMRVSLLGGVAILVVFLLSTESLLKWAIFQLNTYRQCLLAVQAVATNHSKIQLIQTNFDSIWADLKMEYNETDAVVILSLYENIDAIYRAIRHTEFFLFIGEFMHPECSSAVAMEYVPFQYPFYDDIRLLWIRATDQVQELRREIESVRLVQGDQVMFEKNFDTLVDGYESIVPQFSSLMETVEQLSKMDVSFQNSLHTFPYSWLSSVVPRLDTCFISHIVQEITECDEELQTRPIYVLHTVWEEKFQRLQLQQQRAQQRRKNVSIALNEQ